MEKISLKVSSREKEKNLKKLRREGFIPAVTYGSDKESKDLKVNALDFKRAYEKAGENTVIEVEIDGKEKVSALIYDVQLDTLSGEFIHADLFQVDMKKEVEADVPLEFVGVAPAVKELGGVLVKAMDFVEVKCLPSEIPQNIEADLSLIKTFDDHVTVGDLKAKEGVEFTAEKDAVIASVTPPRSEAELSSLDEKIEEDVSQVEGVEKEEEQESEEEKK
jgi:large subunit ribosomal protein L25